MPDFSPETRPLGKHSAESTDAAELNLGADKPENWRILVGVIEAGIDDARERHADISEHTARAITRAIANTLGDCGRALDEFARAGSGSYAALSEEYLDVYNDPATPTQVRTWINWLGTYLVQQHQAGSGRRFMNESAVPDLDRLLVATRVTVGDTTSTVHIPASKTSVEVKAMSERLNALPIVSNAAFRVFLTLSDVDASSANIEESFHEAYVGEFISIEDALYGLVELEEWETDLHNFAADRGILPHAVSIDHDVIEAQTREIYDLVENGGVVYVFNK